MENEEAPPYVEYLCADASVRLVKDVDVHSSAPQRRWPQEGSSSRCKPMFFKPMVVKIIFLILLIVLGPTLTFLFMRCTEKGNADASEVPPDVMDLTLEDVGVDSFTVSWERPSGHFDYYWVEVTDDAGGSGGSEPYRVDSCRNGTIIHPDQTRLTCTNLEACTYASITVRTQNNGPPARSSPGVTLGRIYIPGKEPGDFKVNVRATSNTSAVVVVHVSHIKSCLLDECKGDCSSRTEKTAGTEHKFTCNDHGGNSSTVLLTGLEPGTEYACYVWLRNFHKGESMSNLELEFFNTPN